MVLWASAFVGIRDAGSEISAGPLSLGRRRRPLTRSCLDWSERRPHLAGELGAALLTALLDRAWLVRRPGGRAVAVTPRGAAGLDDLLGIDAPSSPARCGRRSLQSRHERVSGRQPRPSASISTPRAAKRSGARSSRLARSSAPAAHNASATATPSAPARWS